MRQFLRTQRAILASFLPYYFNLFALVVNKAILFGTDSLQEYIPYTFEHPPPARTPFSREAVKAEWLKVEKRSAQVCSDSDI